MSADVTQQAAAGLTATELIAIWAVIGTVVSAAIGAGAALFGSLVGRKRRERREDLAAWRDKKHAAYVEILGNIMKAVDSIGVATKATPNQFFDDASAASHWRDLRRQAEADREAMRQSIWAVELMGAGPVLDAAVIVDVHLWGVMVSLPNYKQAHELKSIKKERREELIEMIGETPRDALRKAMIEDLGIEVADHHL